MSRAVLSARLLAASAIAVMAAQPASSQSSAGVWPNPRDCSNISPLVERQCIGRRVDAKERMVERLYARALASVRSGFAKWGRHDNRLDPRHFIAAHRDWRRFIDSNCTAVGAFGGGSNSSISDRITECNERELDERIELYRRLADGSYGI